MAIDSLFPVPAPRVETDERYTPRWVFDGLGLTFDLDPAAPIERHDHVPARARYTRLEDGLAHPWHGLVWLNPPFSQSTPWADRFRQHGNGVFLGPVANSRWWCDLASDADLIWHCRDFRFDHPDHGGQHTSMPLAFIAIGEAGRTGLARLARSRRHPGLAVVPWELSDAE